MWAVLCGSFFMFSQEPGIRKGELAMVQQRRLHYGLHELSCILSFEYTLLTSLILASVMRRHCADVQPMHGSACGRSFLHMPLAYMCSTSRDHKPLSNQPLTKKHSAVFLWVSAMHAT